jgi:hypothetical protein
MTDALQGVAATVEGALRLISAEGQCANIPDPMRGLARDGVPPGAWEADELGLPPDCPVRPLGYNGDIIYLVDVLGQLVAVKDSSFGQGFVQRIFGNRQNYLYWAWPTFSKGEVKGFDVVELRRNMYHAAAIKGLWSAAAFVRGRGAWEDEDGTLVLHCGDYLWRNGELLRTGEHGEYFYPRRQRMARPWAVPVAEQDSPALHLFQQFKSWNWQRQEVDPMLMLGWVCASMLGGALPWRPSMFLTGDKATGKSTLQQIIKAVLGAGLIDTTDTTPAGIYQRVHQDALPVAVDELEAEADNRRASGVIKLARLAASGGLMLRGGADHQGVEFQARSMMLFSAINAPPMPPQDLSRMAVLSLQKLDPAVTSKSPVLRDADQIGPKILRRLADSWPEFEKIYEDFRAALRLGGHDSRGQDTYGIFLTCAYLALGDYGYDAAGYNIESFDEWADLLSAASLPERLDATENWVACLHHLLTTPIEAWRNGTKQTLGATLEPMMKTFTKVDDDMASQLAQAGVAVISNEGQVLLAIPNKGVSLARIFTGSVWGGDGRSGVWAAALRQGPASVIIADKSRNRVYINGVQERCTLVDMKAFRTYCEQL